MAEHRALVAHSSRYFLAQIAGMAAGLISLPIFTRVLTKEEFGQLSLLLLSVNFLTPFARLGLPQSIPRHLPEYARKGATHLRSYISSLLLATAGICAGLILLFAAIDRLVRPLRWGDLWNHLWLIGPLLGGEVALSVLAELYRAELRSGIAASLTVISRYATLVGSLSFFLFVSSTFSALLTGKAILQFLVVAVFVAPLIHLGRVRLQRIDRRVIMEGMRYGLPLSLAASGGFFIAYGDRYIIQAFLDAAHVATYSVPYDLLQQVETMLTTPIRMAIVPMVFSLLANGSVEQASDLVSQVVRAALFLIVPMVCGISFLGRDIIVLLASDKYADASVLLPVLALGILFGGISFLFSIGLMFQKRTTVIACLTLGAGVVNLMLNVALIPLFGVIGSAWATLITYAIYPFVSYRLSARHLRLRFYPGSLALALLATIPMLAALWILRPHVGGGPAGLVILILVGTVLYALTLLALEADVRRYAAGWLKQQPLPPQIPA